MSFVASKMAAVSADGSGFLLSWNTYYYIMLVLCEDTRDAFKEKLEIWKDVMDSKGLRVTKQKTEY